MNETTPRPFDHRLPQHVADFVAAWLTYVSQDPTRPVASVHLPDGQRLQLTVAELAETRDRIIFTRHEAEQLAEKCGAYRARIAELEAAITPPITVWAVDHQWWEDSRVYSTEQIARTSAETYTRENCDRPVTALEWVRVPDAPGTHELFATLADGQRCWAQMWVSPVVLDEIVAQQAETAADRQAALDEYEKWSETNAPTNPPLPEPDDAADGAL